MLENMFIGRPPGNYDRILDFSTAVTGGLFFVPTATFLDDVADAPATGDTVAALTPVPPKANTPASDGALTTGSLTAAAGASTAAAAGASTITAGSLTATGGSLAIGSLKGQPNE
jgi:hypothetical protein